MSKEKSPYGKYTVEEIRRAEACSFVIQVGNDLFVENGKMVFSERTAAMHYNKILDSLLNVIDGGDEAERKDALMCMVTLQILPLRIN